MVRCQLADLDGDDFPKQTGTFLSGLGLGLDCLPCKRAGPWCNCAKAESTVNMCHVPLDKIAPRGDIWAIGRWMSSGPFPCRIISYCHPTFARRQVGLEVANVFDTAPASQDMPTVGDEVLAATGMEDCGLSRSGMAACRCFQETSFLCDSTDLAALRKQLGDEGSDDDSISAAHTA